MGTTVFPVTMSHRKRRRSRRNQDNSQYAWNPFFLPQCVLCLTDDGNIGVWYNTNHDDGQPAGEINNPDLLSGEYCSAGYENQQTKPRGFRLQVLHEWWGWTAAWDWSLEIRPSITRYASLQVMFIRRTPSWKPIFLLFVDPNSCSNRNHCLHSA